MNMNQKWKLDKVVWLAVVLYAVVCACVSLVVIGLDPGFFIGLAIGTAAVLVNFRILGSVVRRYLSGWIGQAGVLYILRLGIYFAGGMACFAVSLRSVTAYGIGVLGILVGAAALVWKEQQRSDRNDQC